ncbi:yteA family sporulation protein, partial [Bacillus cereus]|nr:yteA family sporulation protein [Bacillus cereus]
MYNSRQINQFKSVLEKQKQELEQTIQTHEN